ncbi:hypothetical protein [Candidatus Nitronereus thalassa]|uniref:Uncharacterized protein n=1 Tax=Candidatus Nitronereus thalassa TaxID=3020898 RepID=A0ABU3K9E3_9BACT|nr:hypothetical protein [Candidatus Nitronereus thalassa]MDT7043075.1 hypothetical protein [Candidatus Nitronereus thalassa]
MDKLDYFGLEGPEELFKEIQSAVSEYSSRPSERLFFFLIFSLNHLREWIAGSSSKEMMKKNPQNDSLSKGELFFFDIWNLNEFQIINSLCNRGKHFLSKSTALRTSKIQGLNCRTGKVSDSLDQEYFLIDGVDSRDIFHPVVKKYHLWFKKDV